MNSVDFLQTYSEIAIAIIGFSGVVVALKGRTASDGEKITLSMLILFGSAALILGVLPQILLEAGVPGTIAWQCMSLLMVVSQSGAGFARSRQAKAKGTELSALGGVGFAPIMLSSIALAAINSYFGLFWLYMGNLLLYLLASIAIFRKLVGLGAGT
jgi:hypothetical protein